MTTPTTSRPPGARRVRSRLVLPALAVGICLAGLATWRAIQLRAANEELQRENALRAAANAARSLDDAIAGTEALLVSIGELAAPATPAPALDSVLRRIVAAAPIPYLDVVVLSPTGEIRGRSSPVLLGVPPDSVRALPLMREVMASRRFAVGAAQPALSRAGHPLILPFLYPVPDPQTGEIRALVNATMLVDSLEAVKQARALPAGSVLTIMNTAGTVIYRTLDTQSWIGRSFRGDTGTVTDVRLGERVGAGKRSADGNVRLVSVRTMDRAPWIVYVGLPLSDTLDLVRDAFLRDAAIGVGVALLLLVIGLRSTLRVVEPIESLTRDAIAIADGRMNRRSTVDSPDEIGDLARAFNSMADTVVARDEALRASHEQLLHAQKMEALGQLAGGIAHDFNNSLHVIIAHAELAASALPADADAREDIAEINDTAARAAALTRQILVFSRKQVVTPTVLDLNVVVSGVERMLARLLGERRPLVLACAATPVTVRLDRGELEQVLLNLVTNARDAISGSGTVTVRTSIRSAPAAGRDEARASTAILEVTDTGVGIAPELCERIFDPFFTTKERAHGTGLGLAIAYGIIDSAGGRITVTSTPGIGTTFTVTLPVAQQPVDVGTGDVEVAAPPASRREGPILVVDDDAAVLASTSAMLRHSGHHVLAAPDGPTALAVLDGSPTPVMLLLTDLIMPGMTGIVLAREATRRHPGLPVVCMSGYADDDAFRTALDEHEIGCIMKPFSTAELQAAIARACSGVRDMSRIPSTP